MKFTLRSVLVVAIIPLIGGSGMADQSASVQHLVESVGIKSSPFHRGQMDTIGFASTALQMERVFLQCDGASRPRRLELDSLNGWTDADIFSAAVCPHDDYYYAGRLYPLALSRIHAKHVILIGVFHRARVFDCRDKLVFDQFTTWHAPLGPVTVSPLRERLLARLPSDHVVVDNTMHQVEHSLEAIVPWLQAYHPDVQILPVLVPNMNWTRLDTLAQSVAVALKEVMAENQLTLGDDVAIVCSSDAVHYGDTGWGGKNFAPFGVDTEGYRKAVERDERILLEQLSGELSGEKLEGFYRMCVDDQDDTVYKLTWCGRFSIPFGLNVANRLSLELTNEPLQGTFLGYGTSISEASLDVRELDGMGATAPNNLHHWVGYAAAGYR